MEKTYLVHHGIKGQKWGIRRFQNEDGTYTEEGKRRYGVKSNGKMSFKGKRQFKKDKLNFAELSKYENRIKEIEKNIEDGIREKNRINSDKFGSVEVDKDWINAFGKKEARRILNEMFDDDIDMYTEEVKSGKEEYKRLVKLYGLD